MDQTASNSEETPARRAPQKRALETRVKIMKAAMSEFARLGFDDATTRGIAEAAGVPHSLVIYHFRTKEILWYRTVSEAVGWYGRGGVLPAGEGGDRRPATRLRHFFAHYIRFSAEYPDFFRMLTHENKLGSERLAWHVRNHVEPAVARTAALIRKAQAAGEFVPGDPVTLIYMFLGCATGPYRSGQEIEALTGKSPYAPTRVEEHIATCERLFFR